MTTTTNILPSEIIKKPKAYYYMQDIGSYDKIKVKFITKSNQYSKDALVFEDKCNFIANLNYSTLDNCYLAWWHYKNDENRHCHRLRCALLNKWLSNVKLIMCENYKLIVMLIYNKYLSDNSNSINANKVLGNKHLMRHIASYLDNGNGN